MDNWTVFSCSQNSLIGLLLLQVFVALEQIRPAEHRGHLLFLFVIEGKANGSMLEIRCTDSERAVNIPEFSDDLMDASLMHSLTG